MADMPAEDLFVRQTERLLALAHQVARHTEATRHRDRDVEAAECVGSRGVGAEFRFE